MITTPESLFLLLTSRARESLRGVETVIIDEVHAVAGTKRGAHLRASARAPRRAARPAAQRIGLSATVRPVEEVAGSSAGHAGRGRRAARDQAVGPRGRRAGRGHVRARRGDRRRRGPGGRPHARRSGRTSRSSIVDLIAAHRSTIVFANAGGSPSG
jgi:ATP-dependent Lhr-like helicase